MKNSAWFAMVSGASILEAVAARAGHFSSEPGKLSRAMALTGATFLSFSAPAQKGTKTATGPIYGNADAINEDELKAYMYFLASDQLVSDRLLHDRVARGGWGKVTPVLAPLPGMPF